MTFKELYDSMYTLCKEKIDRDTHKGDPMACDMRDLIFLCNDEWSELITAINSFELNKSEKNRQEALKEVADNINFLLFMSGKISGTKELAR